MSSGIVAQPMSGAWSPATVGMASGAVPIHRRHASASSSIDGSKLGRLMARYLVGTSPQAPRLEPDVRLSPHPAQHFQIGLRLCSVAWGAYGLEVAHAISLCGVF